MFYIATLKCPRRKYLSTLGIEGIKQFRQERNATIKHICEEVLMGNEFPKVDNERIAREIEEIDLKRLLDEMKERVTITHKIETDEGDYAYIGEIDGEPAFFNISTSSRFYPYSAYSLFYVKRKKGIGDNFTMATVMPVAGKIRFYPPEGLRTKSGAPDKRDKVGSWSDIMQKVDEIVEDYNRFKEETESVPEQVFGECGTCPYHNVEIDINDKTIICNG